MMTLLHILYSRHIFYYKHFNLIYCIKNGIETSLINTNIPLLIRIYFPLFSNLY